MARPKCKDCKTCFQCIWVNSKRYYHCSLCDTWYGGQDKNLQLVENPTIVKEQEESEEDDA